MITDETEKALRIFVENPGYLLKTGWLKSIVEGAAVDAEAKPVPWITYPALDFLVDRVSPEMAVFEYGSGSSTLWWGKRVKTVVSCEHDKEWYAEFRGRMPAKIRYILRRAKGGSRDYAEEICNYSNAFDIIVIDGRDRVNCVINCLPALRAEGVIVWDDSDRTEYQEGYDFLAAMGFKHLDFWGMGPLATRRWCTSIYYRSKNCLKI